MGFLARHARRRAALLVLAGLIGWGAAALVGGSAVAQPRHGKGKPKTPPAHEPATAEEPASEEHASTPSGDAGLGPVPPPPGQGEQGEGGVKPSPLNPAPNEFSTGDLDAGAPTVDYDKLLGDIAALRARVAAVGDTLFHSRLAISVETDGDHGKIVRFAVSVDDGVVYSAPANFHADDMTVVYGHAVAPGRHAITVDVERKDDRNDAFRNTQKSRFIVEVPQDQELGVEVKLIDDSAMGADFPSDHKGSYDLRVRVKAAARPIGR